MSWALRSRLLAFSTPGPIGKRMVTSNPREMTFALIVARVGSVSAWPEGSWSWLIDTSYTAAAGTSIFHFPLASLMDSPEKLFGPVAEMVTPEMGFFVASTRVPCIKVGVAADAEPANPKSAAAMVAIMTSTPTRGRRLDTLR